MSVIICNTRSAMAVNVFWDNNANMAVIIYGDKIAP